MNKRVLPLFLFFFVFISILNSQVTQQWVARYIGPGNSTDRANCITADGAGNVYVTGYSTGSGTGFDFCTIKYNSAGVQQWVARYNGPGNSHDWANSIVVDAAGNVYVTGADAGSGTGSDFCTIKYNSAGVQQWVARYNGPENSADEARSIAIDGAGNIYVTGYSTGSGTGYDFCTIKYNSTGTQLWVTRYNGPNNGIDKVYSLVVGVSGNLYVTGESQGNGPYADYCTIKYNSAGTQQWVAIYNGPENGNDVSYCIAINVYEDVFVTGRSSTDYCTIKYNSAGAQQWVAIYNGQANDDDRPYAIAIDGSGNVYVTGYSFGSGTFYDYCTIKYNSTGAQQWVAIYNGPANNFDKAYSIAVDAAGNVYITGESDGGVSTYDYCTIKYNSAGVQQWLIRYNGGNGPNKAYSIAVDTSGNVYVTGESKESVTEDFDYCTIKYTQGVGIKNLSTEIPTSFSLEQNYPNPFNAITNIKFSLPKAENVKLIVLDLLGREMATLVNDRLQAGTYSVDFDASNLTSGVYFYRITTGEFSDIKKMILIK